MSGFGSINKNELRKIQGRVNILALLPGCHSLPMLCIILCIFLFRGIVIASGLTSVFCSQIQIDTGSNIVFTFSRLFTFNYCLVGLQKALSCSILCCHGLCFFFYKELGICGLVRCHLGLSVSLLLLSSLGIIDVLSVLNSQELQCRQSHS